MEIEGLDNIKAESKVNCGIQLMRNNDIRKDYISDEITDSLMNSLELLIKIYNILLLQLIEKHTLIDVIKIVNTDLNIIMQKITKLLIEKTDNKIQSILTLITYLKKDNTLDYLDIFIKKIKKKNNINNNKLEQLLLEDNFDQVTPIKYINLLINEL